MKYAVDFRSIAREVLRGKWMIALVAGLIAVLLGALGSEGPEIKLNVDAAGANVSFEYAGQTLIATGGGQNAGLGAFVVGNSVYIILAAVVLALIFLLLGSVVEIGYARFNLELVDNMEISVGTLFRYFSYWTTAVAARLLQGLYILLWTLLFIIPGIIAAYSYAMTSYILAEHPELTASEAISRSKELMEGNRWRLFCLRISFIGWDILCAFTLGLGSLWLTPYKQAATAAFYREISGT